MSWNFCLVFIIDFKRCIPGSFDTVTSLCMGFHSKRAAAGMGPNGLISASKQIHHTLVVHDSAWVTVALHTVFFYFPPKWCAHSTVWLLHGWCRVKLLMSWCTFCVHHTTMHQFTASLCSKPHMSGACVFSCKLVELAIRSFGTMIGIFYIYMLLWCIIIRVEWIPK